MRRALVEVWQQTVDATDLVICLGDVTVGPARRAIDEALAMLPGDKILVVGNHEFPVGSDGVKVYGFEAVYPPLVCDTDPPLLLPREPLEEVPAGAVNGTDTCTARRCGRGPAARGATVNVNCEVTAYRPMHLAELAATAWAVLAGDVAAADDRGHGRAVMNTGPKRRRRAVRSFDSFAEYEAWQAEHEPFDAEALAMTPEERLFAAAALTPNSSGRRPPSASTRSTTMKR